MLKLRKVEEEKTMYDEEIEHILMSMAYESPDSDKYKAMLERLVVLQKNKPEKVDRRVSPDTIATVAGNLAGIGLILGFERMGVITSKALGFVLRNRI